jgi:hypothetical protein
VLSDYKFYYAVRRTDASNITYSTTPVGFIQTTGIIMDMAAELLPPGETRDAVLRRHFTWELGKLLLRGFLDLDRATQQQVKDGIRELADRYMTDNLRERLNPAKRIPVSIAQHGDLDQLVAVIRHLAEQGLKPVMLDGHTAYAAVPGFRDSAGFPDSWFEVTDSRTRAANRLDAAAVRWGTSPTGERALIVSVRGRVTDSPQQPAAPPSVLAGDVDGVVMDTRPDGDGTVVRISITVDDLLDGTVGRAVRRVKADVDAAGRGSTVAVQGRRLPGARRLFARKGMRLFVIAPTLDHKGRLAIATIPVTPRRIVGRLRRALR